MRRPILPLLLICLQCCKSFGQAFSTVEAPQDDLKVLAGCSYLFDPELQPLAADYNELLRERFWPMKIKDVAAVFGPKLDQKPADRVKPLFTAPYIGGSGLLYANSKKHVDFHAIGNLGYLEIHYQFDGESFDKAAIYLRADDQFVPIHSTNDIPRREAWDKSRYEALKKWLTGHLPGLTDLGVVRVSISHSSRVDLGGGSACVLTTRDIHVAAVPFWLEINIAKDTTNATEKTRSMQYASVSRANEPVSFTFDDKFYLLTPKLVDKSDDSK